MSRTRCDRFAPRSHSMASGTPNHGTTSSASSRAILEAFWSGTPKTKGHFVNRSCTTTTWQFPLSANGRSMTSIPNIWKGRRTGMGWGPGSSPSAGGDCTLRAVLRKLYSVSKHVFPPPAAHHRVEHPLPREMTPKRSGVCCLQYLLLYVLRHDSTSVSLGPRIIGHHQLQ